MIFWIIIGVAFYNLARQYGKNKFVYLGIGVGLTLVTQLITGFVYGLIARPSEEEIKENELVINLVALLISGIVTFIVYRIMKKKAEKEYWEKEESIQNFGAEAEENKPADQ